MYTRSHQPPEYAEKPAATQIPPPPTGDTKEKEHPLIPPANPPTQSFTPRRTLTISTLGQSWFRLPLPSRNLVTPILRGPADTAYVSTRRARCSGDCILTTSSGEEVSKTSYFFGPGRSRSPVVFFYRGSEVLETRVESLGGICSRAAGFHLDGEKWEWRYETDVRPRIEGDDEMKTNLLVLYRSGTKVAELVRNDETRTEGTSWSYAGNGGVLVMGDVDEVVVVATAMVMLKREVDRRRLVQMMIIGGAAGGC